jgi:cytochrome P450
MAFAMFEMKIVLATVLQRAALSLAPGTSSRLARRAITFAPSDGARVVAHAR